MKPRFVLFRRGKVFYCQDSTTGRQASLRTRDAAEAPTLLHARNEAFRQPLLNLQLARTYLSATDPEIAQRSWRAVMDEMGRTKTGVTLHRHESAMKEAAFDLILVAEHVRSFERQQDVVHPDHEQALLRDRVAARDQKILLRFLALCPQARAYHEQLAERRLNVGHHRQKIVALSEIFAADKTARAIADAHELCAYHCEHMRMTSS